MTDNQILQLLLDTQEWQTFECKRAAAQPHKLLETVVAFANTDGGIIVIGLDDPDKVDRDSRMIGISENFDNISEFLKLIEREIDPPIRLWNKFELDIVNLKKKQDKLLIVDVKKSNDVHSLKKGDTFIRHGSQNVKIGSTEIIRLKYEKGTVKYEDELSGITSLEALDYQLFSQFKQSTNSESQNDWQFLKDNGLAIKHDHRFELTKAGVLLFDKNPSVTLKSKCGVKITHYYGTKPTYSGEPNFVKRPFTIEGPLLYQIKRSLDYFCDVVKNSSPKLSSGVFKPSLMIPEWAFQEAITNAVIHRNYFIENDIQIRFFDDKIEIESPGTYPGHITVSNIRSERFSRNPIILRTLNRFQSAPNLDIGEGVDRMFRAMKENNLYEPLYFPPNIRPNSVLLFLLNLQRIEYWDTVSKFLEENYRINNKEARRITGIDDTLKMSRLLKSWADKGILEKVSSKSKKTSFYIRPGQEAPPTFIFRGVENK